MGDEMILNNEQKKVVYSNERFLFLLAGAGSGKTRVIVERIKYLIEIGIEPSQILAITFTRKASFEMKDRVNNSLVHIHTFHQFCYQRLIDDFKQEFKMVDENVISFKKEHLLEITKYKNSLYQLKKPRLYDTYQMSLANHQMKDFDDLLLDFYFKIRYVNHNYRYSYIFIDEFQDTNHLQYELLKLLIRKNTNVLAVGDPDQSIYVFRGASSQIINLYIKDYQAKLYTLSINYRSSPTILYHANRLIKRNNRRYRNELIPNHVGIQKVYSIQFSNEIEEAEQLIDLINKLQKLKIKSEEIAVLYRNHQRSYELQKRMRELDIVFQTFDENNNDEKNGVQLMTIHKAKGLEFDAVIIIGLEMGVLPSSHDNRQWELDEERRLMFVAMTRARDHLYFSSIQKDTLYHTFTSSVFISESGLKTIKKSEINGIIRLGEIT